MSIFTMVYEELKAKLAHLTDYQDDRLAKEVFNALDTEDITDIILDNGTFWFEYSRHNELTDQQYAWLVTYLENKGYKHLYRTEVYPNHV